ncbi:MAG TPA: dienelactone hydrolase family protein [Fimbriimonas sp.]|nr:dienelactone hydrolase family protein [Fimbriimonas sp.]
MQGEHIQFSNGADDVRAYIARPTGGKGPGIVVIQEWWGLVPHIVDVVDRFASEGFTALAPDLFHGESTTDPDEATTLMQALNIEDAEAVMRKAILVLMADAATEPSDKVGVIGFCMGGQLAMFAAGSNPAIQAVVNFYGIHPKVQPSYRHISGPVLGIFAENDNYASPEAVRALDKELTLLQKPHEFHTYAGTQHAFFNDTRPEVYNAVAAQDAWKRTLEFFRCHLG